MKRCVMETNSLVDNLAKTLGHRYEIHKGYGVGLQKEYNLHRPELINDLLLDVVKGKKAPSKNDSEGLIEDAKALLVQCRLLHALAQVKLNLAASLVATASLGAPDIQYGFSQKRHYEKVATILNDISIKTEGIRGATEACRNKLIDQNFKY